MDLTWCTLSSIIYTLLICRRMKLATHYIQSRKLEDVKASLAKGSPSPTAVNSILDSFSGEMKQSDYKPKVLQAINDCFGRYEIPEIIQALKASYMAQDNDVSQWAFQTLKQLDSVSPTSIWITHDLIKKARRASFMTALRNDYALSYQFCVPIVLLTPLSNSHIEEQDEGLLRGRACKVD